MFHRKTTFVLVFIMSSLALAGCKWRDDFRSRVHPQYQEQEPRATFNEDSDDYVGDEVAKGIPEDHENVDAIDDLSEIPELPKTPGRLD